MKVSAFISPPSTSVQGTVFLSLVEQMVAGFHPSAMFTRSINDFAISFEAFLLFVITFMRGMHWPLAVFNVLTN